MSHSNWAEKLEAVGALGCMGRNRPMRSGPLRERLRVPSEEVSVGKMRTANGYYRWKFGLLAVLRVCSVIAEETANGREP